MKRKEINAHPAVAPLLATWRSAIEERERLARDNRFSFEKKRAAEKAATEAGKNYDAAVRSLLGD